MPSVLSTEDLSLWDQEGWERTLHVVKEFGCENVHNQDSCVEIAERKLVLQVSTPKKTTNKGNFSERCVDSALKR